MNKHLLLFTFYFSLSTCLFAQPGALDLSFNPGAGGDSTIWTVAMQPDGKALIGGCFTTYNGMPTNRLARLNPDGSPDTSFNTGTGADRKIHAIALQPDGRILVGGDLLTYNGDSVFKLVRLMPNGLRDTSFNTGLGFGGGIKSLVIQPDGKILVGGNMILFNGQSINQITRLMPNGSADSVWQPGLAANGAVSCLTLQPDSHIIIGGSFTQYDGQICLRIARAKPNGKVDSTFNTGIGGAGANVDAIALQPNGQILLAGQFTHYNGTPEAHIVRVHSNGTIDFSFIQNSGANMPTTSLKLLPSGNVLVGGEFSSYQGKPAGRIALLNQQGIADSLFRNNSGTGANDRTLAITTQPSGKILIAGDFTTYNGTSRSRIARLYNCLTPQPDSIYGTGYAPCSGTPQTFYVQPVTGATKYEWTLPNGWTGSSDSTSIIATGTGTGGVITVKAFTDSCGWSYVTSRAIATIQPPGVDICLVTVDTQSTHNIIMWEKPVTTLIDSFCIYRETATNTYTKIASVAYGELSEYHDTAANPNVTSYRYKLSVLDTCGAESALSSYHSTIHFQNLGSGNFQWTFYQIEGASNPVMSFNVYRDNLGNGSFSVIGNVPGTNATFFDNTFNSFANSDYVIDANWSISCTPTRAVNTTRSNIKHKNAIDALAVNEEEILKQIEVYPNPAHQEVYVRFPETVHVERIELLNALGQVAFYPPPVSGGVPEGRGGNVSGGVRGEVISLENLPKGIYILNIETGEGISLNKKIVIQ